VVWSKAPVIFVAHDTGPLIRSKNGLWLAIPTPAAGKSSSPTGRCGSLAWCRWSWADRNHRRLQTGGTLDRQIDRARRSRLDPVAEPAQRAVGGKRRADAGAEGIEDGVTGGALHDRLDLGPVLVVVAKGRERHLGLPRLAIAQDQEACRGHALGQHVTAQGRGG
jgi:hypothetical protein